MKWKTQKGKEVDIPDEEIDKLVDKLDLSIAEACNLWLEDNELQINEEQEQLDKKAKDSRITATIHEAKADKPKKERKVVRNDGERTQIKFLPLFDCPPKRYVLPKSRYFYR